MAWCPFAIKRPLSENHTQGRIKPRAVVLHTAVSSADSLYNFFQYNSDLESHFYVSEEGRIEQYMDTEIMADANKNANSFAVSIETEDGAKIRPWTPVQLDALVRLVTWICDTHGIPKRQIPTAYGSGIGWHVQFGAPGPWTPVAKSCPGQPRIDQTRNELIPRVARGGGGGAAPAAPKSPKRNRSRYMRMSLPAGKHAAYFADIPEDATHVCVAFPRGTGKVRLIFHGDANPNTYKMSPKESGVPDFSWKGDFTHDDIDRLRSWRKKIPEGATGVSVYWEYHPDKVYETASGAVSFRYKS